MANAIRSRAVVRLDESPPTRSCWRRFVQANNCPGSNGVCHRPLPARHLPLGMRPRRNVLPKSHGERKVSAMAGRAPRESEEAWQELRPPALNFLPILMTYT